MNENKIGKRTPNQHANKETKRKSSSGGKKASITISHGQKRHNEKESNRE